MHALFFEVTPRPGHEDHYFKIAAVLRPILEQNKGLIFIDRYKSLARPGTILSHSLWKDEASLVKWRNDTKHQGAQRAGREEHFSDYRLRIARVIGSFAREDGGQIQVPDKDQGSVPRRLMAVVESNGKPYGDAGEHFLSVNRDDVYVSVMPIESDHQGSELISAAGEGEFVISARLCLVSRDYGMFERSEAPQTFAPMKPVGDIAQ